MFLSWFNAIVFALVVAGTVALSVTGRISPDGKIQVAPGQSAPVTGSAAEQTDLRRFVFLVAGPFLLLSAAAGYGLARNRHWTRPLLFALSILSVAITPALPGYDGTGNYIFGVVLAVLGWWYLYRKPNVVAYYSAIAEQQRITTDDNS